MPMSGLDASRRKPNYLTETSRDEDQAHALRKLLSEADEQRHARTKATLGATVDA
jgi:hypothetical protein